MTTQNKHTPLPWEYRNAASPDNTGGFDCAIVDGDGKIIAETFEHVGYDPATAQIRDRNGEGVKLMKRPAELNAEFITRACNSHYELVEALEAMLSDYRTEGCPDKTCSVCARSKAAMEKASSALARATGKEGA